MNSSEFSFGWFECCIENDSDWLLVFGFWFLVFGHVDFVFGFNWNLKAKAKGKKKTKIWKSDIGEYKMTSKRC